MADALTKLEILSKSYQFYTGGQDLLDNMTKVKAFAGKDPKDFKEAKKVFGLAAEKYKPLRVYLSKIQEEVLAAVKGGFPEIPNPALKARANMEKVAKSKGPNGPGFELELDLYIKHLTRYERSLAERLSFMRIVKDKCDLNIKNFTQMDRIISSTLKLLKAIFVAIPEAQTKAGVEILNIMQSNIENKPKAVANAYKKLKKAAEQHEKLIAREHAYAKGRLKAANNKKLKFVMEDAKEFFKQLF